VIVDYLLGDYTTGIELLARIAARNLDTKFIFLTDEPSVSVAVEAMKMGALDYILLQNVEALNKITRLVEDTLATFAKPTYETIHYPILSRLVFNTPPGQELVEQAINCARSETKLVVINGASGSGRTTVAQALHRERQKPLQLFSLDLSLWDKSIESIFNDRESTSKKSILIENIEADDGELLQYFEKIRDNNLYLTLTTNSGHTARSWHRVCGAQILSIPKLSEREADFLLLVEHFYQQAAKLSKTTRLSAAIVEWLATLAWPGDLKQLRAVVHALAFAGLDDDQARALALRHQDLAAGETSATAITIQDCTTQLLQTGNLRIAAARLGCTVKDLREVLNGTT
jgi:DNA-binding NtrC family response regulator